MSRAVEHDFPCEAFPSNAGQIGDPVAGLSCQAQRRAWRALDGLLDETFA